MNANSSLEVSVNPEVSVITIDSDDDSDRSDSRNNFATNETAVVYDEVIASVLNIFPQADIGVISNLLDDVSKSCSTQDEIIARLCEICLQNTDQAFANVHDSLSQSDLPAASELTEKRSVIRDVASNDLTDHPNFDTNAYREATTFWDPFISPSKQPLDSMVVHKSVDLHVPSTSKECVATSLCNPISVSQEQNGSKESSKIVSEKRKQILKISDIFRTHDLCAPAPETEHSSVEPIFVANSTVKIERATESDESFPTTFSRSPKKLTLKCKMGTLEKEPSNHPVPMLLANPIKMEPVTDSDDESFPMLSWSPKKFPVQPQMEPPKNQCRNFQVLTPIANSIKTEPITESDDKDSPSSITCSPNRLPVKCEVETPEQEPDCLDNSETEKIVANVLERQIETFGRQFGLSRNAVIMTFGFVTGLLDNGKNQKVCDENQKSSNLNINSDVRPSTSKNSDVPFERPSTSKDFFGTYLPDVYEDEFVEDTKYECQCCYDDVAFDDLVQCSEGHLFCCECLKRFTQESVYGGGKATLTCFVSDGCTANFPLSQLRRALPEDLYTRYEERVEEEFISLAHLENFIRCKYCNVGAELDEDQNVFTCPNENCKKSFCRLCKNDWEDHVGLKCYEVEKKDELKIRLEFEEKMAQAKIRQCPKCNAKFTKEDGCNKITCRCGVVICYICRKTKIGYNHFCQHMNQHQTKKQPKCKQCSNCPLWSNVEEDDDMAIRELKNDAYAERLIRGFEETKEIGAPETEATKPRNRPNVGHYAMGAAQFPFVHVNPVLQIPRIPPNLNVPPFQNFPQMPGIPPVPNFPQMPRIPPVPNFPQMPRIPNIPTIPRVPSAEYQEFANAYAQCLRNGRKRKRNN